MDKLTLDTNILRDWAWSEGRSAEPRYAHNAAKRKELEDLFKKLQALRDAGVCEIGITSQLFTDYGKELRELPQYIVDMIIGPYVYIAPPDMFGFPLSFPVVFPDKGEVQRIFDDVFPNSRPGHKKYHKNQKDAWQLYAHQATGRDIFVTEDEGILRRQSILAEKWNIQVKSLHEYVLEANGVA